MPVECTVTSQLDYIMNSIITLCARLLPSTINGTARVSFLNTVFADNAYVHIIRIILNVTSRNVGML